ncbi:DUF1232 domain-containing protein [Flavobacterium sinopsychrotolerans]|jgi:hypothetical protein|uniref:Uncharacterized protein n=1 Tax=Flavobacterium sinopsychrotolerans TaxID=604089 RepID=A0A1H8NNN0_9FLAO|nr:hypothetical protein SAMN04487942_2388 [Flavobacterium sinopsychrotolerans]
MSGLGLIDDVFVLIKLVFNQKKNLNLVAKSYQSQGDLDRRFTLKYRI